MVEEIQVAAQQELPKLCKNAKCCGQYTLASLLDDEKILLPLTKAEIRSELRGAHATTNVELTYQNPSNVNPFECTYTFPLEKASFLAKFEAKIDDRTIETKI